mgnify:CR=1 FL=1
MRSCSLADYTPGQWCVPFPHPAAKQPPHPFLVPARQSQNRCSALNVAQFQKYNLVCRAAIAEALEDNAFIKELSLRGNNMGDTGAQALAASLAKSSKLTKLDLSDNGICGLTTEGDGKYSPAAVLAVCAWLRQPGNPLFGSALLWRLFYASLDECWNEIVGAGAGDKRRAGTDAPPTVRLGAALRADERRPYTQAPRVYPTNRGRRQHLAVWQVPLRV